MFAWNITCECERVSSESRCGLLANDMFAVKDFALTVCVCMWLCVCVCRRAMPYRCEALSALIALRRIAYIVPNTIAGVSPNMPYII